MEYLLTKMTKENVKMTVNELIKQLEAVVETGEHIHVGYCITQSDTIKAALKCIKTQQKMLETLINIELNEGEENDI